MPLNLLSADDFRAAAQEGGRPDGTVFRFSPSEAEVVGDAAARTRRFIFSDATVDHSKDSVSPKGWDLSVFYRNPVALFSHMSWEPPIGRASNVGVQAEKLVGDIEFASADIYPFADTVYRLVDGGFLKAVSVGFIPKEWAFSQDKERPYGIDFKKQLLAEISICAVPCNPNSLMEARSMGIDTAPLTEWAEKVLDSGETVFMPRKELEALRIQAKGAEPTQYYVQADRDLSPKGIERMREGVKRWREDPNELLILEPGCTLRAVGQEAAPVVEGEDEPLAPDEAVEAAVAEALKSPSPESLKLVVDLATKAGRRVSAATKAKMQTAIDLSDAHHAAITKCLGEAMGQDDDPADPDDAAQQDAVDLGAQPPGAVVLESDDHLTPEERRLKEVAALRASLPKAD